MPSDSLASWNEGPTKATILDFVRATTDPASKTSCRGKTASLRLTKMELCGWNIRSIRKPCLRVIVPMLSHRSTRNGSVGTRSGQVLSNDRAAIGELGEADWAKIIFLTHSGISQAAFRYIADQWISTTKHPRLNGAGVKRSDNIPNRERRSGTGNQAGERG